jgi:hypothetical protein
MEAKERSAQGVPVWVKSFRLRLSSGRVSYVRQEEQGLLPLVALPFLRERYLQKRGQ